VAKLCVEELASSICLSRRTPSANYDSPKWSDHINRKLSGRLDNG